MRKQLNCYWERHCSHLSWERQHTKKAEWGYSSLHLMTGQECSGKWPSKYSCTKTPQNYPIWIFLFLPILKYTFSCSDAVILQVMEASSYGVHEIRKIHLSVKGLVTCSVVHLLSCRQWGSLNARQGQAGPFSIPFQCTLNIVCVFRLWAVLSSWYLLILAAHAWTLRVLCYWQL